MFFDDLADIERIASRCSCAIFVLPHPEQTPVIQHARQLAPAEGKKSISVEEVRDFTAATGNKATGEQFFIISPADTLSIAAQNALLKNLEEPRAHYHYILYTSEPGQLLPTIRSRAAIFFLRIPAPLDAPVEAPEKVKQLARSLIAAPPRELPALAEQIAKSKPNPRLLATDVASTAIEILEKSYFKTGKVEFLLKLAKFLKLADALSQNGHVKLHIVADLC